MAVKFDVNKALADFKTLGGKTKFEDSLKQVLKYMQNDKNLNTLNEVAWLLATAKVESDYSLQRWESDYLCGKAGVPYDKQPCERAIRYYKSTDGKKNYFDLGTDKNGMAYFGRGLIQLTGKSNYDKYGKKIGVDLINDGDKALIPKNSYNIASAYFKDRKVFDYANQGNFPMARKSVKGSSSGWENAKNEYDLWMEVLKKKNVAFKKTKKTRKQRINRGFLYTGIVIGVVGFAISLIYFSRTKKK
jgi:predicted chitinase